LSQNQPLNQPLKKVEPKPTPLNQPLNQPLKKIEPNSVLKCRLKSRLCFGPTFSKGWLVLKSCIYITKTR